MMGDAAKQWNAAIEDPSKLIEENREWLRAARMLVSGDEAQEKEGSRIMNELRLGNHGICCPIPFTEAMEKKCAELHEAYLEAKAAAKRWKSKAKKLRASVTGGLLSDQNRELREEIKHVGSELANALIREQELWAENQKLKNKHEELVQFEIAYKNVREYINGNGLVAMEFSECNTAEPVVDVIHTLRIQLQRLREKNERLKAELAASPHWVPVAEFKNDSKFHIVWDADDQDVFDAKMQRRSGAWLAAYTSERLLNVTHILAVLNPPVIEQDIDPRGDGDIEEAIPDTDAKMTTEQMADAFGETIKVAKGGYCKHENTKTILGTPYDSCSRECAECGIDIDAIAASSNDPAGDASDIERAIRERLLQPFLGSEAEKLGATKYQLRDGERWECKYQHENDSQWSPFLFSGPTWGSIVQYRLAKGDRHAATD